MLFQDDNEFVWERFYQIAPLVKDTPFPSLFSAELLNTTTEMIQLYGQQINAEEEYFNDDKTIMQVKQSSKKMY